jgi:hypothetical protein
LPIEPRVSLHVPNAAAFVGDGRMYWASVQVCPMYSLATHTDLPSVVAAP